MLKMHGNFDCQIEKYIKQYNLDQQPISVNFRDIVPDLVKPDRATHLIHSYPAKLLMHIPYFFLNNSIFSKPSSFVLDPFAGSGTVLLESVVAGRNSYGADANPLARLISEVKTTKYSSEELDFCLDEVSKLLNENTECYIPSGLDMDFWFLPDVQKSLGYIFSSIQKIDKDKYKKFLLVCFSNTIKKVSLANPSIIVPVKLKKNYYPIEHPLYKKVNSRYQILETLNVKEFFLNIVKENINRAKEFAHIVKSDVFSKIISTDARKLTVAQAENNELLPDESVDLIITSPPYAGAQKYIRSSKLSLGWLEYFQEESFKTLDRKNIGRENYSKKDYNVLIKTGLKEADVELEKIFKIHPLRAHVAANYLWEMREAFKESVRVLKTGGYMILVAANNDICGSQFKTQEYLMNILLEMGLTITMRLVDDIKSYGLMTKRNKTASIITQEWVLVFQK